MATDITCPIFLTRLVDDLNDDEHGEDLRLEHRDVLKVEGDVEQRQEGVDELEQDQLEDHVPSRNNILRSIL